MAVKACQSSLHSRIKQRKKLLTAELTGKESNMRIFDVQEAETLKEEIQHWRGLFEIMAFLGAEGDSASSGSLKGTLAFQS